MIAYKKLLCGSLFMASLITPLQTTNADTGRLIVTGAATTYDGTAGGGIVPMALIGGLETSDEIGGTAFVSYVDIADYTLTSRGFTLDFYDRVELSFARYGLNISDSKVAFLPGDVLEVDSFGVKVKLVGDAIYEPDSGLPQISAGLLYKRSRDKVSTDILGSNNDDYEYYVAATKLYFDSIFGRNLLINGVVRATRSNQGGILGFGGDRGHNHELHLEGSASLFLTNKLIIGVEYKDMPNNLGILGVKEKDWFDGFVGYFPTKNIAIIAAYVDLGQIGLDDDQHGYYLSLQATY